MVRLPNAIVTAAFLLLLSETGWNSSSLFALTIDGITKRATGDFDIQGYKSRTDDDTPIVTVSHTNKPLCILIELMLWNRNQLILLGLITENERHIWFGWQSKGYSQMVDPISHSCISSFCSRHKIPLFSPSDLRPARASAIYLETHNIDLVRMLLGHNDLTLSSDYLENNLIFRLNEARIFEFIKRLESTVSFISGSNELVKKRGMRIEHIDTKLIPVGDGSRCSNIYESPWGNNVGDRCDAVACHADGGCKNNKIVCSPEDIEMAIRTLTYYRSRWLTIREKNIAAFNKMHIPRILFCATFLYYTKVNRPQLVSDAYSKLGI